MSYLSSLWKSTLSDISIAVFQLFFGGGVVSVCIVYLFLSFSFQTFVSLYLRYVFCKQHIYIFFSCDLGTDINLTLIMWVLGSFTFNRVAGVLWFILTVLVFVYCLTHPFCSLFSLLSYLLFKNFYLFLNWGIVDV